MDQSSSQRESKSIRRSTGTLCRRRIPQPWPDDKPFRILSLDGGGIKGLFSATFLAGLEKRYLDSKSVVNYFDLIVGTSTGGILALGLAAGYTAEEIACFYRVDGMTIFPPPTAHRFGRFKSTEKNLRACFKPKYDGIVLKQSLDRLFSGRVLNEAKTRLCVPSYDGQYGETYIFKTPHHPDYRLDAAEPMTKIALATSAAPTFFKPLNEGAFIFLDGGVWANNPIMVGLVDAIACFGLHRNADIRILSIGCGDEPYLVRKRHTLLGGKVSYYDLILAAMHLESHNALGQAGLLIGRDKLIRVVPHLEREKVALDDWERAVRLLPSQSEQKISEYGPTVCSEFLFERVSKYVPYVFDDH